MILYRLNKTPIKFGIENLLDVSPKNSQIEVTYINNNELKREVGYYLKSTP